MEIDPGKRRSRARVIKVDSQPVVDSSMLCCDGTAIQREITYKLTVNDEKFRVPKVWAYVCIINPTEHIYFAKQVGQDIADTIFRRQHPVQAKIAQLLGQ
jgi:hypothetical protein